MGPPINWLATKAFATKRANGASIISNTGEFGASRASPMSSPDMLNGILGNNTAAAENKKSGSGFFVRI